MLARPFCITLVSRFINFNHFQLMVPNPRDTALRFR
jgi:hypothetical protein